jgi:hypothetical protein
MFLGELNQPNEIGREFQAALFIVNPLKIIHVGFDQQDGRHRHHQTGGRTDQQKFVRYRSFIAIAYDGWRN